VKALLWGWVLGAFTLSACFGDSGPQIPLRSPFPSQPTIKRITGALEREPQSLLAMWLPQSGEGAEALQDLLLLGLGAVNDQGQLEPRLAESIPTLDNQQWRVGSDGRIEVTWRLREGARWHDGTPITADDLIFTLNVARDPALPGFAHPAFDLIEQIEATDGRTVKVTWRQASGYVDRLFTTFARPLPRHLLESTYLANKSDLLGAPYWTNQFVGSGPYRLQRWERGRQLVLQAQPDFVLGRPGLDEIDVEFIPDVTQLRQRTISDAIQVSLGSGLPLDQTAQLLGRWPGGRVESAITGWIALVPELRDPESSILGQADFRRALTYATDRLQMVDSLQAGLLGVAHTFVSSDSPEYGRVEERIVRYRYDRQLASQMIEELGYTRDGNGRLRSEDGAPLGVLLRVPTGDEGLRRIAVAIVEDWRAIGIGAELLVGDAAQSSSTLPTLFLLQERVDADRPLGESAVRVAGSDPNYARLMDGYFRAGSEGERSRALGDLIQYETGGALRTGIIYQAHAVLISSVVQNVTVPHAPGVTVAWNAHQWSLR
jgi:peptide/nickel transport system substrate-binding protein